MVGEARELFQMRKQMFFFAVLFIVSGNTSMSQPKSPSIEENQFQSALLNPWRIVKVAENHYFIDFGKDAFGTVV